MKKPTSVFSALISSISLDLTAVLATLEARADLPEAGDVLDLGLLVDEPIGLYANGQLVAKGTVIISDDHFALQITELAGAQSPAQEEAA